MDQLALLTYSEDLLDRVVRGLADDEMEVDSNCPPWTIRHLASHALKNQLFWAGSVVGEDLMPLEESMAAVPYEGDLGEISADVTAQAVALWHRDGVMTAEHPTPFGVLPGPVVLNFAIVDAAAHAWDVSASLGRAIEFTPETVPPTDRRLRAHLQRPHGRARPDQAADRTSRRRHRHRTAPGLRRAHDRSLTRRRSNRRWVLRLSVAALTALAAVGATPTWSPARPLS